MIKAVTAVVLAVVAGAAPAQTTITLTGLEDFSISQVGEGFLSPISRTNVISNRFQVQTGTGFGQWTAFNILGLPAFAGLEPIASASLQLFPAINVNSPTTNSVTAAGTLSVYFTTDTTDVLDPTNGFDWIDSDPTGLGSQFSNLTLVGQQTFAVGQPMASIEFDLAALNGALQAALESGSGWRLVLAPDETLVSSWGVGVQGTGFTQYFGPAPVITVTTIPTPGALALLAPAGLLAARRRR